MCSSGLHIICAFAIIRTSSIGWGGIRLKTDVRALWKKAKTYWKDAPQGRYMPFREIAAVSLGGMGVKFITNTVVTMIVSTGNVLIGNTIGIPPMHVYFLYLAGVLANIPLTTLRARIIDYSHLKKGKYRPFVFLTAIPTALLGIGFVVLPYDRMSLAWKCASVQHRLSVFLLFPL